MGKIIPAIIVDNPTYPERNRVNSQNKKQMNRPDGNNAAKTPTIVPAGFNFNLSSNLAVWS